MFTETFDEFALHHKKPINIIIHVYTTSVSIISVIEIFDINDEYLGIYFMYLCFLFISMNENDFFISFVYFEMLRNASYLIELEKITWFYILLSSICLQEFSHYIVNEKTYLSEYIKKDNYIKKFINHTLFLGSSVIIQFVNKCLE